MRNKTERPVLKDDGRRRFFQRGRKGEIRWLVHAGIDSYAYSNGRDPLEPWRIVDAASDDDWREVIDEDELRKIEASLA
ncbi:hypothetical protein [Aureimonas sp. SK2]|uniref:hypothetical protein n=1 Tax=Aureimonas sp. SK2 TaxID=3015992 RepID=UPI00244514A1|nr:hypothetical protein [Aureimonas sp. SK2]